MPEPAPHPPSRRLRWLRRPRLLAAAAVAVAVILAGSAIAAARGSSSDAGFRTATVASRQVDQTLDRVGTIEPVAQAIMSFPVSGTVAAVDVAVGDRVSVGQSLAHLDTTSLDGAVAGARAALDQAELTLERALNGESVSAGPTGSNSGGVAVTPAAYTAGDDDTELTAAQQAVLAAQQQVDTDLAAAQQALDDAQRICAAVTATDDPAPAAGADDTTTSTPAAGDSDVTDCRTALTGVLDAQQTVAASQSALADASRALDQLLTERSAEPAPSDDSGTGTPDASKDGTGEEVPSGGDTGGTGGQSPSGGSSSSPTSAELVAYQKAVDAAAADVAVAEQATAQATLVSPIAGTVQQVGVAVGDTVTAGSTTAPVVVVSDGGYEVTTTVTVDDLPDVEVGQAVSILADGTDEPVDGEVVAIGTVGTSSGSATTYPVTIGPHDAPDGFRNGATASLSIVTARTSDATAVPTSAVHVDGGRATVTVLDGGKTSDVTVSTGAVGPAWTEITEGLDVGQTVVLADLDEPLPSDATDVSDTGRVGGFGGFGGFNR